MPINVTAVPSLPDHVNSVRLRTAAIVNEEILPREGVLYPHRNGNPSDAQREAAHVARESIKNKVRDAGLWAPHLPTEYGGMGLDFLAHAYMNEILAYAGAAAFFGVVAPNSGNQVVLAKRGTEEQKRKWLIPLIEGTMESGFSMTEPEHAGSDPRSLATSARREGDEWVINGHKWFTSNGKRADFFIVMCVAEDPTGELGRPGQQIQIIVPTNTKGVDIVRGIGIWGAPTSDHCEIRYTDVRVPVDNQLGEVGQGHEIAQERLGAGRVFHCMNSVGAMWRAFDLMVERSLTREVHGGLLRDKQFVQGFIADSYIDLQTSRLMTIKTAELVDRQDPRARVEISALKVYVPNAFHRVVDRAIQVWGAAGVSSDLPLAGMYLGARTLRLADGPDEVHRILVAKSILHHYEKGESWDFAK
ncbi:MAG TPA: acyl-CoA dehydrogenase family protein [Acidimicrobiales bacterium]|jgi:acyl-CoA dehydrogenase|nr:acyl-CoA dehydrogenase family protein [Acidimicrobiales bacterium]